MTKINRGTILFYCLISIFLSEPSYAVDPAKIMHSAQTMVREAITQHERIAKDRYNQPLITIVRRPQLHIQKIQKKKAKK